MKIALLLEREPFAEIFEETLSRHLSAVAGRPRKVRWSKGRPRFSDIAARREGLWLCNGEINAVFSARAESRVFEIPWREYLGGHPLLKTVVHTGYLAMATAPVTRWFLASHHLWIHPEVGSSASTIVLGGNSRIRLIDFERGLVTTVLKSRFDDSFMARELEFRQSRDDLQALPILEVLEEGRAYVEPLIHGTNADRVFDKERAGDGLREALESCMQLSRSTVQALSVEGWVESNLEACRSAVRRSGFEDSVPVQGALDLSSQLGERVVGSKSLLDGQVEVGASHGDLQPGNVLIDDQKNWLIDWERVDRRAVGYDGLTLALKSRREINGLLERTESLIRGEREDSIGRHVCSELGLDEDQERARALLRIFFLEEIRFHLEENAMGPFTRPTVGLTNLVAELGPLKKDEFWNGG